MTCWCQAWGERPCNHTPEHEAEMDAIVASIVPREPLPPIERRVAQCAQCGRLRTIVRFGCCRACCEDDYDDNRSRCSEEGY